MRDGGGGESGDYDRALGKAFTERETVTKIAMSSFASEASGSTTAALVESLSLSSSSQ